MNGQKKESPKKSGSTLRFELELTSQTDESTNEFSYAHLVEDALKKVFGFGIFGTFLAILKQSHRCNGEGVHFS